MKTMRKRIEEKIRSENYLLKVKKIKTKKNCSFRQIGDMRIEQREPEQQSMFSGLLSNIFRSNKARTIK
jgi:hypothetical protein